MAHMSIFHFTHVNRSCHTCTHHCYTTTLLCLIFECVISHVWMSHVPYTYWGHITISLPLQCVPNVNEWNMWMSHVTHVDESCHTCGWVMSHRDTSPLHYRLTVSHLGMSHVSRVTESRYTCGWVMPHMWIGQVTQGYNIDPPTIRARADRRRFLGTYVEAFFFF